MQKRSNGLITSFAHINQYPNKMIKDTKPFPLADICLRPAEGKFWYQDPPQRRMGVLSLAPPPLILNEGFFHVFLCCWWGVSGSRKNEDFLGRAFKCRAKESLSLSLSPSQFFLLSLAHPKWAQASQPGPAAFKDPKEQLSSTCPFPPLPPQPFLLPLPIPVPCFSPFLPL